MGKKKPSWGGSFCLLLACIVVILSAMETQLIISLEDFPPEGKHLTGELDGSIFALEEQEISSIAPLYYDLSIQVFDKELVVHGSLEAEFRFCCARCAEYFEHRIICDRFAISEDISEKLSINITEQLREELLLLLPNYPKCDLQGVECEIKYKNDKNDDLSLDKGSDSVVNSPTASQNNVWAALDGLQSQD